MGVNWLIGEFFWYILLEQKWMAWGKSSDPWKEGGEYLGHDGKQVHDFPCEISPEQRGGSVDQPHSLGSSTQGRVAHFHFHPHPLPSLMPAQALVQPPKQPDRTSSSWKGKQSCRLFFWLGSAPWPGSAHKWANTSTGSREGVRWEMEKAAGSGGGWGCWMWEHSSAGLLPLLGLPLTGSLGRRAEIRGLQLYPAGTPSSRKQPCSLKAGFSAEMLSSPLSDLLQHFRGYPRWNSFSRTNAHLTGRLHFLTLDRPSSCIAKVGWLWFWDTLSPPCNSGWPLLYVRKQECCGCIHLTAWGDKNTAWPVQPHRMKTKRDPDASYWTGKLQREGNAAIAQELIHKLVKKKCWVRKYRKVLGCLSAHVLEKSVSESSKDKQVNQTGDGVCHRDHLWQPGTAPANPSQLLFSVFQNTEKETKAWKGGKANLSRTAVLATVV